MQDFLHEQERLAYLRNDRREHAAKIDGMYGMPTKHLSMVEAVRYHLANANPTRLAQ